MASSVYNWAYNTIDFVIDDIRSHFVTVDYVIGPDYKRYPVKVFRSRDTFLRNVSYAMNIGGEIHIGHEMYRGLLLESEMGIGTQKTPLRSENVSYGKVRYYGEIMAHELGHQVTADKLGFPLYQTLGAFLTIDQNCRVTNFECDASCQGIYYGFAN